MDPSNEIQLFGSCLLGRRNSEPAVGRIVVALVTFEEPRGSDDPRVSSKIVGGGHLTAHPARPWAPWVKPHRAIRGRGEEWGR